MSALKYKKDWEEAKEHYRKWWNGEYFGRCAIAAYAPLEKPPDTKPPQTPADPVQRWTDPDFVAALNEYNFSRTFYGGEAFPIWHEGYPGHAGVHTFLGCPVTLDFNTGWSDPILLGDNWDARSLKMDKKGRRWWNEALEMMKKASSASKGRSIPSVGAFGATGDTLAAMRGTDKLLLDLYDCPEKVIDAEDHILKVWIDVYKEFYKIIKDSSDGGSTCWFELWAPGKFYAAQNDLSYMISTDMFERIFIPALKKQLEFLDYAIYHVDGIGAFKHVPMLCGLKRLRALQILPGAGKPSPLYYMDVLRTVQSRGKNLHISIAPNEVEEALKNLSAKGLFIATWCASESEARELLEKVKEWSKDR